MGRLKMLRSDMRMMKPAGRVLARDVEAERRDRLAWRAWYGTARWKRLRWQCLERDNFTCAMCKVAHHDTSKLVGDHTVRHRGDPDLFWDLANLQCLCKTCHDSTKARQEGRAGPAARHSK